jgi:AraC-like DNA-binding protein
MNMYDSLDDGDFVSVQPNHEVFSMAALADRNSSSLRMRPSAEARKNGQFIKNMWHSEHGFFADTHMDALATCHRTKCHADNVGHLILLSRYFGGTSKGTLNDQTVDRRPGPLYLMDAELPWEGIREAGRLQTAYIPKCALGFDPDQHPRFLEVSEASPLGQCLHARMDELFQRLQESDYLLQKAALDQLLACMKVALTMDAQREDIRSHARAALHRTICGFIEQNVHAQALSTTMLLDQFGVSRASLYRMFEAQGGVRNYITERRALRAVIDLSDTSGTRGHVRQVSDRWGFATPVHFNRVIRRLYGDSPGALFEKRKLRSITHQDEAVLVS